MKFVIIFIILPLVTVGLTLLGVHLIERNKKKVKPMNYELFRHNFDCLRKVSWSSENTMGDDVMFELMDTAATITVANVRLPVLKRGVRTHHLSLKNLPIDWKLDLNHPCWSDYVELIDAVIPDHPKGGRFVMIATERGDVHWTTYGY